jgi:hypothetical protein
MNGFPEHDFSEWYLFEREVEALTRKRRRPDPLREPATAESPAAPAVEDLFAYRARQLERAVASLRRELYTRLELRDQVLEQIDYQISKAAHSLKSFTGFGLGYNVGVDVKRNQLEKHLADLRKERRNQELRGWDDTVALRRELRRAQDELADAERRGDMARG